MRIVSLGIAAALLCGAAGAVAAPSSLAYNLAPTVAGNQAWAHYLGLDFTVVSPFRVYKLGAFDDGANGITTDVTVGIFNLTTQSYVTPIVNFNGTTAAPGSAYALKSIAPVTLTPGNYSVISFGFNASNQNYNTNMAGTNGNSPISFNSFGGKLVNGVSRFTISPNVGTDFSPFPHASAFAGGTFGVPEPGTWAMMIVGMGLVGFSARRRKAAVAA